ncbi:MULTISPECIES: ABC transporter permease [Brevibacillus]|jgi:oligopeptide transport system permease protein|uniref:ABC transporter permease n=1 Tax=Brevibacillus TaxID=55080 RepID=UPI000469A3B0|nr:ABC transporter permease [Brevibacillus borstelensis]KKX56213.1 peptide ABC transporter permease [Brevibacillus borstelensis cifa_chp40]MBE5397277.1 ABC transporter permease [Brevibacillus borstelensis]MCM3470542.1 ABC transporter permease [Brevibacillus borstelensis]MCM3558096.1 ABC transporter permease [Brevibacillus borstelensis]MCM3592959.1 ABC transporter permease [Brevibacillus borstelensis]
MKRYIGMRLVYLLITLFVITTATFFLMKQLPGTPFDEEKLNRLPVEERQLLYASYGLDQPVYVQYVRYLANVVQGDFGTSFTYKNMPVKDIIANRIGPSALIGLQAVVLGLSIGLILGIIAAYRHNSAWDYFTMFIAVLGVSVPNFVLAALLQYYVGLKWGLLPVAFWDSYENSILPSVALSVGVVAIIARFARNEMLEVLQQDYITTAKAKGLTNMAVVMRHAVRNSLIPVVTILGPIVVNLLTGSLVIENIFGVPGIGSLFVDSIKMNDYSTIMGITIFYSAFYVFIMLIVDMLYSVIDPRIRLASGGE